MLSWKSSSSSAPIPNIYNTPNMVGVRALQLMAHDVEVPRRERLFGALPNALLETSTGSMGGRGTFIRARLTRPSAAQEMGGLAAVAERNVRRAAKVLHARSSRPAHTHELARACTSSHTRARASPVSCRIFSGTELGPATSSPELDSESPCRISTWTAHPSHTCAATWPALLVARCVVRRTRQVYAVLDGSRGFYAPMAAPLWRSETG